MSYPVYQVPSGDVLPIMFDSFDGGTGASITMSGLAVTDIEIYKDGGTTQRASDAGYTLLDTDGIDFDGITGIHGFSIDTGDNTDAGFYTVGAWFHVVVSAITVDAQTVNFIAAAFRLMAAESIAANPKVDVAAWLGTAAATPTVNGVPEVDVTHWIGTAAATPTTAGVPEVDVTFWSGNAVTLEYLGIDAAGTLSGTHSATTADLGANAPSTDTLVGHTLHFPAHNLSVIVSAYNESTGVATFDDISATGITLVDTNAWILFASAAASSAVPMTANVTQWNGSAVATPTQAGVPEVDVTHWIGTAAATPTTAGVPEVDVTFWRGQAVPATTQTGVPEVDVTFVAGAAQATIATQASVDAVDDFLDTEVAAIKAKTDQLTFTVANQVDANAESMNATTINGTGTALDLWRGA